MRFAARMIVIACLAAAVLVPAAAAADRMWVGFQDDPMFRWDPQRMEAMDQARGNNARTDHALGDAEVGERRAVAAGRAEEHA